MYQLLLLLSLFVFGPQDRTQATDEVRTRPVVDVRQAFVTGLTAIRDNAEATKRLTRSEEIVTRQNEIIRACDGLLGILSVTEPTEPPPSGGGEPPPSGGGGGTVPPPSGGGGSTPPSTGTGSVPAGPWVDPATVGATGTLTHISTTNGIGLTEGLFNASNLSITSTQGNAVTLTMYSGTNGVPVRWTNVDVYATNPQTKWGGIYYDVVDYGFVGCSWRDIPIEHGLYLSCLGGMSFDNCLFARCGGQGVQMVGAVPGSKREFQTAFTGGTWTAEMQKHANEWITFTGCAFIDNGYDGSRGSFPLSAFDGPVQPVRVDRCTFSTKISFTTGTGTYHSRGAMMAHNRRRVEVVDSYVYAQQSDRDVIQFWFNSDGVAGTVDTLLDGNTIDSDQWIDLRGASGDTIKVVGNSGTAMVRISTNPKYTWPNIGAWDPARVLYTGPISDNVTIDIP